MGFQELAEMPQFAPLHASLRSQNARPFIVGSKFLLLDREDPESPDARGGRDVLVYRDLESLIDENPPEFEEIDFYGDFPDVVLRPPPPRPPVPSIRRPPFMHLTRSGEEFFRLSANHGDRRINSDGSVASGTYATTLSDLTVTPSGLAAVARFALPVRVPACYVFHIIPKPNTPIYFGTVRPKFGFCGGGVEVYFPDGCEPGCARLSRTLPLY